MDGWCKCDDPIVNFVGEKMVDSLEELGKFLLEFWCPILNFLDYAVEVGSAALPGIGKGMTTGASESSNMLQPC